MRRENSARPAAYVIRNGRASPAPEKVERKTLAIAGRAIETMIASNGVGDLYRIYTTTQRDRIDFNLALIGDDFKQPLGRAVRSRLHGQALRVRARQGSRGLRLAEGAPRIGKLTATGFSRRRAREP